MGLKVRHFLLILLIAVIHNIHANDEFITTKAVETHLSFESNRNFDFFSGMSLLGEVEFINSYSVRSGISAGRLAENVNLKTFTSLNAYPFERVPLFFTLLWNYNGLTEYDVHSNSIIPVVLFDLKVFNFSFGASFGLNFRFTSFFGEPCIFEWSPVYSFFIFFIDTEPFRTGFLLGNYNEFEATTLSDYSLSYIFDMRISHLWRAFCEFELMQSGGAFYANTFYGISFKTGVRYSW